MNQKIKTQKGFIQIPLLIWIIASLITVSAVGTGVVLHKQGKLAPLLANVSQVFKGAEKPITTEPEQVKPEEVSQQEQELEQARLEAEKAKQEVENLKQELEKQKQEKTVQQQPTALSTPTPTTPPPTLTPEPQPEPQPIPQSNFSDFTLTLNPAYINWNWIKKEPKTIYPERTSSFEYVNSNIEINKTNTYRKIVLRKVVAQYIGNMPEGGYYEVGMINIQGSSFKTERQGNLIVWTGYKEINVAQDLDISISFYIIHKISNYMQYQIDRNGLYFYERIEIDTQNVFENQFIEKPIIIKGTFPILSDKVYGGY